MAGIVHRSDVLLKEDEDALGDLFGGEDDDEGGEEEKDDADAGDEEKEGEEGDEEGDDADDKEEEEEPPKALSKADIAEFGPGRLDQEVDSKISDIFTGAMKTAQVASEKSIGYPGASAEEVYEESLKNYNLKYLMEEVEEDAEFAGEFDLGYFTDEIARYIKNYDVLLDMEGMIFNKARQFIINKFGPELEQEFVELLATAHDVDLKGDYSDENPAHGPVAAGASAEAAGA